MSNPEIHRTWQCFLGQLSLKTFPTLAARLALTHVRESLNWKRTAVRKGKISLSYISLPF